MDLQNQIYPMLDQFTGNRGFYTYDDAKASYDDAVAQAQKRKQMVSAGRYPTGQVLDPDVESAIMQRGGSASPNGAYSISRYPTGNAASSIAASYDATEPDAKVSTGYSTPHRYPVGLSITDARGPNADMPLNLTGKKILMDENSDSTPMETPQYDPSDSSQNALDYDAEYQDNPKHMDWLVQRNSALESARTRSDGATSLPKLTQEETDAIASAPSVVRAAKAEYQKNVSPHFMGVTTAPTDSSIQSAGEKYNTAMQDEADRVNAVGSLRPDIVSNVINPDDFATTPTKKGEQPRKLLNVPWMAPKSVNSISRATPATPNNGIETPSILKAARGGQVEVQPDGSGVWTKKDGSTEIVQADKIKLGMSNGTLK